VLLAAPQLLPLLELHALGPRAGGLEATAAAAHDMWPRHLATFLDPYWFGDPSRGTYAGGEVLHWEIVANIGLPALLLAGVALVPRWSRRPLPVGRLLVLGALFAMLSLGQHGPLGSAARRLIPGFDLFRFPSRYLLHVAFVGALLAAAGADALIRRAARLRVALAVALPLIAYADLHRTLSHYNGLTEVAAWTRLPKTAAAILAQPTPTPTPPRVAALDLADATFAAAAARAQPPRERDQRDERHQSERARARRARAEAGEVARADDGGDGRVGEDAEPLARRGRQQIGADARGRVDERAPRLRLLGLLGGRRSARSLAQRCRHPGNPTGSRAPRPRLREKNRASMR